MNKLRSNIVKNTLSLYGVQLIGLLVPLVLLPYLARTLQPSAFGAYISAQALGFWLGVMLDYGFSFSATRSVAQLKEDRIQLSDFVSAVICSKVLIYFVFLIGFLLICNYLPIFKSHPEFILGTLVFAIAQSVSPGWYFQGMEKMVLPATLEVAARLVGLTSVFVVVHEPQDGLWVLLLQAMPVIAVSGYLYFVMASSLQLRVVPWRSVLSTLAAGWSLFIYRALVALYTSANSFLLSFFVPSSQIGIYGGAERIQALVTAPYSPIWRVLYPRISRLLLTDPELAKKWARGSALFSIGSGLFISAFTFWFAPELVGLFLGAGYEDSANVLRLLVIAIPMISLSGILGLQWLVPLGLERWLNTITLCVSLTHVGLFLLLVPEWGIHGVATSVVISESLNVILLLVAIRVLGKGFW